MLGKFDKGHIRLPTHSQTEQVLSPCRTWCSSFLASQPQTLLISSLSCIIFHCCQQQELFLPFESSSVSLSVAKSKIQEPGVKAPCDTHTSLISSPLAFYHISLTTDATCNNSFVLFFCPHLSLLFQGISFTWKNFLTLYVVAFLKNSLISDHPLIFRPLLLFLFLHKKERGTPGGKQPSFVKLKPFFVQLFPVSLGLCSVRLQVYLNRSGLVWFCGKIWPGVWISSLGNSPINLLRSNSQHLRAPSRSQTHTELADTNCQHTVFAPHHYSLLLSIEKEQNRVNKRTIDRLGTCRPLCRQWTYSSWEEAAKVWPQSSRD